MVNAGSIRAYLDGNSVSHVCFACNEKANVGREQADLTVSAAVNLTLVRSTSTMVRDSAHLALVEQAASAVDSTLAYCQSSRDTSGYPENRDPRQVSDSTHVDALVEAIDHVPALLLHNVADDSDDRQAMLRCFPLVVLTFGQPMDSESLQRRCSCGHDA